jgi:hypothetical protein
LEKQDGVDRSSWVQRDGSSGVGVGVRCEGVETAQTASGRMGSAACSALAGRLWQFAGVVDAWVMCQGGVAQIASGMAVGGGGVTTACRSAWWRASRLAWWFARRRAWWLAGGGVRGWRAARRRAQLAGGGEARDLRGAMRCLDSFYFSRCDAWIVFIFRDVTGWIGREWDSGGKISLRLTHA